ncbi:MAG: Hpt domain-containing protein, partial [Leptospirales bacterium]|nr:Hpt domain-containing protein [Leptospirales bacterium]
MSFNLGEYRDIFLEEADELIQELNKNLLRLEKNPEDADIINNIFRAAHSLKSSAAFVGLNELSDLAHKMENLLQGIRDKTNMITQEIVDVIFKCFDAINGVIDLVAEGEPPPAFPKSLFEMINHANENSKINADGSGGGYEETAQPAAKPAAPAAPVVSTVKTVFTSSTSKNIINLLSKGMGCYEITAVIEQSAQMKWVKGQLMAANLEKEGSIIQTFPSLEDMSSDETIFIVKLVVVSDKDPIQL